MRRSAAFVALVLFASTDAIARNEDTGAISQSDCQGGTYSVVNSPDGGTLSILFDNFSVTSDQGGVERRYCNIQVPLNLPEGYTLGVYRVDYRGFARLFSGQRFELGVDYALGHRDNSRRYHRGIRGAYEGEFVFTENIGAGIMKRVGCGVPAVLNIAATLELQSNRKPEEAMAALDSVDGAPRGGLVYHFNFRKCGQ